MQTAVQTRTTSPRIRRRSRWPHWALLLLPLAWAPVAAGQEWIEFVDESCRFDAAEEIINDLPCSEGIGACPLPPQRCACEKDMAVGDFNGDQVDDVVIVRKQPYYFVGGVSNLLFLNEDGILVDRTDLVPTFSNPTQDRDVVIVDVNGDGLLDLVTASTEGQAPRVYINQGDDGGNWCGLLWDESLLNNDTFKCVNEYEQSCAGAGRFPWLCGIAAGDVNGDGCPDLYLADYDQGQERLFDRLLINKKVGDDCTGEFEDQTDARMCQGLRCLNEPQNANQGELTTGAQIIDLDGDQCPDIIQTRNQEINVVYNVKELGVCTGNFRVLEELHGGASYMGAVGDINDDQNNDLYVVKDDEDVFRINQGDGTLGPAVTITESDSPRTFEEGGNVRLVDMNNDRYRDAIVSDVDVVDPQFISELAILRTEVKNEENPLDVTITDPIPLNESKPWNVVGTYDTAVLDVDGDGKRDLWVGFRGDGGNLFFRQGSAIEDCNTNGVPDACDIHDGTPDCNNNGIPDECDIAQGMRDCNTDGVPDVCCIEDVDLDGVKNPVDLGIVQANFGCMLMPDPCHECNRSDVDGDGQVNPVDAGLVQAAFGPCDSLSPFGGGEGGDGPPPPPMMPWQYLRADLSFELRPVGGGDPVRVLAPDTEYEAHYTAGHDRVNGFALYGIGLERDRGFAGAQPPARGPWADTWNDQYVDIERGPGQRIPAYGYDEDKFRNDLCANNLFPADPQRYAPAEGMIGAVTTRGAGDLDLHLFMYWLDMQEQVLVIMESVNSYEVR